MKNNQDQYLDITWPTCSGNPQLNAVIETGQFDYNPTNCKLSTQKIRLGQSFWLCDLIPYDQNQLFVCLTHSKVQKDVTNAYCQVHKLNAKTLRLEKKSVSLPNGGHTWYSAMSISKDEFLYIVSGNYIFKLNLNLDLVAQVKITSSMAHYGLLISANGNIITKSVNTSRNKSNFLFMYDSDLKQIGTAKEIPEITIGKLAMSVTNNQEYVYIVGEKTVFRFLVSEQELTLDNDWQPSYLRKGNRTHGGSPIIADNALWLLDNAKEELTDEMLQMIPVGLNILETFDRSVFWMKLANILKLNWLRSSQRLRQIGNTGPRTPIALFRFPLDNLDESDLFTPFPSSSKGLSMAVPIVITKYCIVVITDTKNGRLSAFKYSTKLDKPVRFTKLWEINVYISSNMLFFDQSNELLIERQSREDGVCIEVIDIMTGNVKASRKTDLFFGSLFSIVPGNNRDVFYGTPFGEIFRLSINQK